MKRNLLFKISALFLICCFFFSCENKDFNEIQNENIEFTLKLNPDNLKSAGESKLCESLDNASKILLTIQTITGEETEYTDGELSLYKMNGNYFSQKIALLVGEYKLTKFCLLDQDNNVIFATPLEGSLLAQNVDSPLPIEFEVAKDQAVSINVEVICAVEYTPEDFGLVSFWFDKVETFSFLIAVSELGQNIILDADLMITSGSYNYSQYLEPIANNVVIIKDGFNEYMLLVEKDEYHPFEKSFSIEELKTFATTPLVVELLKTKPLHDPVLEIQFDEYPITHNSHIASDGNFLYTINGGIASSGQISKYTIAGSFVESYSIAIDGRGLSYNHSDGLLYASLFTGDIVKITDLENGQWELLYEDKLQSYQASFAISPDGEKMYDFYQGTLNIWNLMTGDLINTIGGLSYGSTHFGGDACIAVDEDYLYTWDAYGGIVYIYDLSGNFIRTMTIPYGNFGVSLSVFDGYLFASVDGASSTGTWYGYNIRNQVLKSGKVLVSSNEKENLTNKITEEDTMYK